MFFLIVVLLSTTIPVASWTPQTSRTQQTCRLLGLWVRYLRHTLSVEPPCHHLGLQHEAYCLSAAFDEVACVAAGDSDRAQAVRQNAILRVEQHRTNLWNGTCVVTISSWNNLGFVEVFLRSVLQHNPRLTCVAWAIADNAAMSHPLLTKVRSRVDMLRTKWQRVSFSLITLRHLRRAMKYDPLELAFRYTRKEFNTAIKPHVFTYLFSTGARRVMYFDPDCLLYSHLDEIALMLHWRSFVVTPHETLDSPEDGKALADSMFLQAGTFNYGFVAMSDSHPSYLAHHLEWWAEKLRYQQFNRMQNGIFYDQKWGNFIPSFYPRNAYEILLDPRYNIASWNLHYRGQHISFNTADGCMLYAGQPVVFYHFSGMALTAMMDDTFTISPYQTRYSLIDFPRLRSAYQDYRRKLAAANTHLYFELPYGFSFFSNGVPISGWMRMAYAGMSRATRQVFQMGTTVESDSLAFQLTVANPFSTASQGSVWSWLFTPVQRYGGILHDGIVCGGVLTSNIVVKLSEILQLDLTHPLACRLVKTIFPHLIAYVNPDDLESPVLRSEVQRSLLMSGSMPLNDIDSLCQAKQAPAPRLPFLCNTIRKGQLHAMLLHQMHSESPRAHFVLGIVGALRRLSKHIAMLQGMVRGVTVMGYFPHALGVAEAGRLIYQALEVHSPRIEVTAVPVHVPGSPVFPEFRRALNMSHFVVHRITVVVLNADQVIAHIMDHKAHSDGRYWIGFWFWELDTFPYYWWRAALFFDEIWTASEFYAAAVRKILATSPITEHIPVLVMPQGLPVPPIRAAEHSKSDFSNIPRHAYVFLTTFDFNSYFARKRPHYVAQAFKLAFADQPNNPDSEVHLVIKSMNGHLHQTEHMLLHNATSGWANIHLIDQHLSGQQMHAMHAVADCFVSLHSSEGYGLNILRPLLEGVPVISTLYGGNMEFQQHLPQRYLDLFGVGYSLEELPQDYGPYTRGNRWAKPNVSQAAVAMRHAADRTLRDEIRSLTIQGAHALASKFNLPAAGERMLKRLDEIEGLLDRRRRVRRLPADEKETCCWIKRPDFQENLHTRQALHQHLLQEQTTACSCSGLSGAVIARAEWILNSGIPLPAYSRATPKPKDPTAVFCYWLRYPDLQVVLHTYQQVLEHMLHWGQSEGRSASCDNMDPKLIAVAEQAIPFGGT